MILINDLQPGEKRFPMVEFLHSIMRHAHIKSDDQLDLRRLGGVGNKIWQIETRLDAEESVHITIAQLLEIEAEALIDELRCSNESLVFGLSDAAFLFIQANDRNIEKAVASEFKETGFYPDRNW